ncbi:hypothetical protein Tco_1474106 [Tanacetum coccineum]
MEELRIAFQAWSDNIRRKKEQEEKRIAEEQVAKARYWKIPICDDDDEEYTIAITPVLPTEKPDNSLSMVLADSSNRTHLYSNPNADSNRMPLTKAKDQIPQKDEIHKKESMIKRFRKRYSRVVCPNEAAIESNPGLMRN